MCIAYYLLAPSQVRSFVSFHSTLNSISLVALKLLNRKLWDDDEIKYEKGHTIVKTIRPSRAPIHACWSYPASWIFILECKVSVMQFRIFRENAVHSDVSLLNHSRRKVCGLSVGRRGNRKDNLHDFELGLNGELEWNISSVLTDVHSGDSLQFNGSLVASYLVRSLMMMMAMIMMINKWLKDCLKSIYLNVGSGCQQ